MELTLTSFSPVHTTAMGEWLGRRLWAGAFIALIGDLGAGKTALSTGILSGLGVARSGGSPTFPLLWEYPGGQLPVYHWDVYRIRHAEELEDLGYADSFYGQGVCLVEWADKVRELWPPEHIAITLTHAGQEVRHLHLVAAGTKHTALLEELRHADPRP